MDTSGTRVWLLVWKAYDALHSHALKSIESLNMCVTDFAILELLLHKGPSPINLFSDKLSLASGSTTAAIDRLERRGLVRRQPSLKDRRIKLVELTADGLSCIEGAFSKHSLHMEAVTGGLSETEKVQVIELLKKLGRYAQSFSSNSQ
jgi:MarR family transcriptional regulator, 2-MHQ and catechol-resistance regulon repressor